MAVAVWLAVWQGAAIVIGQDFLLASPAQVVAALVRLAPTSGFWLTIGASAARIAAGFVLAVLIGTVLAWLAGLSNWIDTLVSPVLRLMRSVPVVSFIILVILWWGTEWLTVAISGAMVLPIVFANVREGIERRDPQLREMAQVFGFSWPRRWRALWLPAVFPYLVAACRVGLGLCWKAGVSAEVIGLPDGSIGERLYLAKLALATDDVLAWTVVIVTLSFLMERGVLALLDRIESAQSKAYAR